MVPQTLLPQELGGDGDPLDAIVLGLPILKGSIAKAQLVGVLKLLDKGERDDKLIAVSHNSPLYKINSLEELNEKFPGISNILESWFVNYKGPGKIKSIGFGSTSEAMSILQKSIDHYQGLITKTTRNIRKSFSNSPQ